jgi:hypothetical protein
MESTYHNPPLDMIIHPPRHSSTLPPSFDLRVGAIGKDASALDEALRFLNKQSTTRKAEGTAKAGFDHSKGIICRVTMYEHSPSMIDPPREPPRGESPGTLTYAMASTHSLDLTPQSFVLFSKLPTELQISIWKVALEDREGRVIFPILGCDPPPHRPEMRSVTCGCKG